MCCGQRVSGYKPQFTKSGLTIYATSSTGPYIFEGAGEGSLAGETAAKTTRRCGHLTLAGLLDDAERSHPKPWVEPSAM